MPRPRLSEICGWLRSRYQWPHSFSGCRNELSKDFDTAMNHSLHRMTHLFQRKKLAMLAAAGILASASAFAQATVSVDVNKPGHAVPPTLWGIFFEDINLSADGGLYPELVRNRSFEDATMPDHWRLSKPEGSRSAMAIDSSVPLNALNRQCLKVTVDGSFILENGGYWGMNIVKGNSYTFTVAARAADGFSGPLNVKLLSSA